MKECFIIMPVSTPESMVANYKDDKEHFKHVLDHLFVPAVEMAKLKPISPIVKGSEVIQGEIIRNIEKAELVLCDMSSLNTNVFFELGIRTALNKPVCLVKDDLTTKVPFDTHIINNHTYLSALNTWELKEEIDKLAHHITASLHQTAEGNSLWKYFGLSSKAHPVEQKEGIESQIGYLALQVEAMRKELATVGRQPSLNEIFEERIKENITLGTIRKSLIATDANIIDANFDLFKRKLIVEVAGKLNETTLAAVHKVAKEFEAEVVIKYKQTTL